MLKVEVDDKFIKSLANEVVKQSVPLLIQELHQKQLPPLLTRKEFMDLVGIGETKCNELFHRRDFYPLTRDFGHPKVVTHLLFEWLNEKAGRVEELGIKYPYEVV